MKFSTAIIISIVTNVATAFSSYKNEGSTDYSTKTVVVTLESAFPSSAAEQNTVSVSHSSNFADGAAKARRTHEYSTASLPTTLRTVTSTKKSSSTPVLDSDFSNLSSSPSPPIDTTIVEGTATFYSVSGDNCGTHFTDQDMVCAISQSMYNQYSNSESISGYCGKNINISYKGKNLTVTVVDSCESCVDTHLDLSPAAFQYLDNPDLGVLDIKWNWE